MNRRTVVFSEQAEFEMADLWYYMAREGPEHADSFIERLRTNCGRLERNSGIGRPYSRRSGVRYFSTIGYYVLYRVLKERVEIINIVHAARDLDAYLDSLD